MTMKNQENDRDQRLADKLAKMHDRMLVATSRSSEFESDEELQSEQQVLDFIERVKRSQPKTQTDNAAPSTKRASLSETNLGGPVAEPDDEFFEPQLPEKIGRFEVIGFLGQGGYGVVYHAIDPELDREVAIKIPRAEALLTPDLRSRFIREGKIAAALSHPNIVTIHETGQQDAICFIVSELVDGITLADWIAAQKQAVDPTGAARLIFVLANALQHAHRRGVLHRDLKPANILIAGSNATSLSASKLAESVKISDFGLARFEDDKTNQTRTGSMIGTPAYMAPEQMNDSGQGAGPEADVYALGCILYELLVGQRVFEASTILEMVQSVQNLDPKPVRNYRKDVSRDLQAICLKCLEKDPKRRYQTSLQLAEDLDHWLNGQPVSARNASPMDRVSKWSRRNPALAIAISLVFVSILSGLCFSLWQWNRAERNLALALEERSQAERHMARVELVIDEMLTDVAKVLKYIPQMEPLRERLLKQAMVLQTELVEENSDDPRVRFRSAQALRRLAKIQSWLGEYERAIEAGTRGNEILSNLPPGKINEAELNREKIEMCLELNLPFYSLNRFESGESLVRNAIEIQSSGQTGLSQRDDALIKSRAYRSLGMILQKQNKNDDALAAFQEAESAVEQLPENLRDDIEIASNHYRVLNSLGIMFKSLGQPEDAETYYARSIAINSEAVDRFPERIDLRFDLAVTTLNFGNFLFRKNDFVGAEKAYRFCIETTGKLSSEFPKSPRFRSFFIYGQIGLGATYRRLTQTENAIEAYKMAISQIQLIESQSGATPTQLKNLAKTYNNMGLAYKDLKQTKDAIEAHQKGIDVLEKLVARTPKDVSIRLSLSIGHGNHGLLLHETGNAKAAKPVLLDGLRVAEECLELNADHAGVLNNLRWQHRVLCETSCQLEEHDAAFQHARAAIRFGKISAHQIQVAETVGRCVSTLRANGDSETENAEFIDTYAKIAIEALKQVLKNGDITASAIAENKTFESLRSHDAFQAFLDYMKGIGKVPKVHNDRRVDGSGIPSIA